MESKTIKISTYTGKSMKWLLYIGIGLFVLNIGLIIYLLINDSELTVSTILNLFMSIMLVVLYSNLARLERTNFMDFGIDTFIYQKTSAFSKKIIKILYSEIDGIQVGLQEIEITKKDKSVEKISVLSSEYNQRIAIKHQFELLKQQLAL